VVAKTIIWLFIPQTLQAK